MNIVLDMKIKLKLVTTVTIFGFSVLSVGYVAADTAWITTSVSRTYVSEDTIFGGCLVYSNTALSAKLNCKDGWVSMDCAGTLGGSKAEGTRKYQEAQLAQVIGGRITMLVNDQKKINGWCVADRVQSRR